VVNEKFFFPGFLQIARQDCISEKKAGEGSIIFSKESDVESLVGTWRKCTNGNMEISAILYHGIVIVSCYRSPKFKKSEMFRLFDNVLPKLPSPKIVLGDLNMDMHSSEAVELLAFMKQYNLKTISPSYCPTTNTGTQIDICFSDLDNICANTYESYFGFHKPLWAVVLQ
jgi:hypothetical protein